MLTHLAMATSCRSPSVLRSPRVPSTSASATAASPSSALPSILSSLDCTPNSYLLPCCPVLCILVGPSQLFTHRVTHTPSALIPRSTRLPASLLCLPSVRSPSARCAVISSGGTCLALQLTNVLLFQPTPFKYTGLPIANKDVTVKITKSPASGVVSIKNVDKGNCAQSL